jgi:hypothetical protein
MNPSEAIDAAVADVMGAPELNLNATPNATDDMVTGFLADMEAAEQGKAPAEAPELDDNAPVEEAAEEEAPAAEVPEGYSAPAAVAGALATEFVLRDASGDELDVPDVVIEYKANGKVRKDRIDQVVKLAQWGVYNEQKFSAQLAQEKEVAQQVQSVLEEREEQLQRLLTDEEYYLSVQEAFAAEMSPERRAERAEYEAASAREQVQWLPVVQQGEQFSAQEIVPAIGLIAQQLHTVTEAELESRLVAEMERHTVRGPNGNPIVPPAAYDAIRKYIVDDLAPWAQIQHYRRTQPPAPATPPKAAPRTATQDQVAAQRDKRKVGQVLRPVGSAAKPAPVSPTPAKAAKNIDEAADQAIRDVLAAFPG